MLLVTTFIRFTFAHIQITVVQWHFIICEWLWSCGAFLIGITITSFMVGLYWLFVFNAADIAKDLTAYNSVTENRNMEKLKLS